MGWVGGQHGRGVCGGQHRPVVQGVQGEPAAHSGGAPRSHDRMALGGLCQGQSQGQRQGQGQGQGWGYGQRCGQGESQAHRASSALRPGEVQGQGVRASGTLRRRLLARRRAELCSDRVGQRREAVPEGARVAVLKGRPRGVGRRRLALLGQLDLRVGRVGHGGDQTGMRAARRRMQQLESGPAAL
eukprot:4084348-Prymnesium_polylepis.1